MTVRCNDCGRFMRPSESGSAWWAGGEVGEETLYACRRCADRPTFKLIAENGSSDPRWCGRVS